MGLKQVANTPGDTVCQEVLVEGGGVIDPMVYEIPDTSSRFQEYSQSLNT